MFNNQIFPWLQWADHPLVFWFFLIITSLGTEYFYIFLLPLIYWAVDKRRGFRLALLFLLSIFVNSYLKDLFQLPRPHGEGVRVLVKETSPGFPSGHAQGSATVWGYLISQYRQRWLTYLGVALIFLVSLSRLYLGVHYLGDVLGGLAIGLALVWLFNRLVELKIGQNWPYGFKMFLAFLLPLIPLLFYREVEIFKLLGFLAGLLTGNLLEERYIGFVAGAPLGHQIAKLLVGYVVFLMLRVLTSGLLPEGWPQLIRYSLLSLWVTVGAPLLFLRLGWARADKTQG